MLPYSEIQQHVINKLEDGLSPALTYHNLQHTIDVLKQAMDISSEEGIDDNEDIMLLQVAALYHDVGFLNTYNGHEEKSCVIATQELPGFGLTENQIEKVCGMIMATKVPQIPQNTLEEIICDADLDYLGRSDFFTIGEGLFREFMDQGIVTNDKEWNMLQVSFLENHTYFTATSKARRDKKKQEHLEEIKEKLSAMGGEL